MRLHMTANRARRNMSNLTNLETTGSDEMGRLQSSPDPPADGRSGRHYYTYAFSLSLP